MVFYFNSRLSFCALIAFMPLFFACMSSTSGNLEIISSQYMELLSDSPKTVAIMPFVNETSEPELAKIARTSFYNHFSSKNYRDIEISDIDRAVETRSEISRSAGERPLHDFQNFFYADYLIYGKVKEFKKIYLGIYSQIALSLEIEMREVETEKTVWKRTILKRSHDGGLPIDPVSVVPAAIRSGLHMKQLKTIELLNQISREMVDKIPEPSSPVSSSSLIDIQVASFEESERAENALREFEQQGLNVRIETAKVKGNQWYRVILGPYLTQDEAENIKQRIIKSTGYQPIFVHRHSE
ncbi:SPOR domain-containing protein [Thermodesulfobacteriota bacterium]